MTLSVCLSVHLSICPSVCHAVPSNLFFFFVSRRNRAIFGRHLSMWHPTKRCSSIFRFRPPNAQNLLPKIACDNATLPHRHPWSRTRQFNSCLEKVGNPLNFGADPCCHVNEIWPRRGDLNAYRLVHIYSYRRLVSCSRHGVAFPTTLYCVRQCPHVVGLLHYRSSATNNGHSCSSSSGSNVCRLRTENCNRSRNERWT